MMKNRGSFAILSVAALFSRTTRRFRTAWAFAVYLLAGMERPWILVRQSRLAQSGFAQYSNESHQ
jgi:hypothetical protein